MGAGVELAAARSYRSPAHAISVEPAGLSTLVRETVAEPATHRDLLLQALLHLPRIAHANGTIEVGPALEEIKRLLIRRSAELAPLRWLSAAPSRLPRLDELEVRIVKAEDAAPILGHFHYLRSTRRDAVNVGALYQGRIVALCSLSPLDLPHIERQLPLASPAEAAVVSRVFAFDWAPQNVISYMLARAEHLHLAVGEEVRVLLTYLNPNMGFLGASYRAANWLPLGLEIGTQYAYLDREYITDRELGRLSREDQTRVEYSTMALRPLQLLCHMLDRRLRRRHPGGFSLTVERPHLDLGWR